MKVLNITRQDKAAFISVFITGFLAYGFIITHHFLTYDSMWNLYSDQNMISSGRQFLTYACMISSDYDLPWLNGLLAFFYLALAAVLLVRLFSVQNTITAVLIGGMLVSFPSVSSTFAYTYTVDGYMLAVLLATFAVFCAQKYRWGLIPAVILLGVSIGIYQAYFPYAILLCIVLLLLDLIFEADFQKIIRKALRFVVMVAAGYIFYVVTLKIMLKIEGAVLTGYQGSDKVTSLSSMDIPKGISSAIQSFRFFVFYENVLTTTTAMKAAFVGICVLSLAELIFLFVKQKCYRDWYRIASALFLAAITPVCTCIIAVMSPENTYMHLLTRMVWSVFFVFAMVLGEKVACDREAMKHVIGLNYVFGIIMIFEFALVANIVSFNMNERYEKSYAMCIRIVDRLESIPEYRHGMKVAILGGFPAEENYPSTEITGEDLVGYFGVNGDLSVSSTANYAEFMRHYLHVTITTISDEEEIALTRTQEFMEMPKFPYEGSIRLIGDVWVIKLNG